MGKLWVADRLKKIDENEMEGFIHFVTHEDIYDSSHKVIYFNSIPMMMEGQLDDVIQKYKDVQSLFRGKKYIDERLFHEVFYVNRDNINLWKYDRRLWLLFAERCGRYYYDKGFQIIYTIHWGSGFGYHIHFIGNAISYQDGRIWKSDDKDVGFRKSLFNKFFIEVGRIRRAEETKKYFERTYGCGDTSDKITKE